jgi:hypothetical protein
MLAQGGIRLFLFFERLGEELDGLLHAQLARPRDQGPVTGDFVMFDGLRARQEAGVERRLRA